jgi:hypothetical protein
LDISRNTLADVLSVDEDIHSLTLDIIKDIHVRKSNINKNSFHYIPDISENICVIVLDIRKIL